MFIRYSGLLIATILLASYSVSPGSIPGEGNGRAHSSGIVEPGTGVTSPLTNCVPEAGCSGFYDDHPALYIQVVSSRSLLVGLDADKIDLSVANTGFRVNNGLNDLPVELTGHSRVTVGFDKSGKPINELRIHILLKKALVTGQRYTLTIPARRQKPLEFVYQQNFTSPSIQVNQVGYLPNSDKHAFAGNWLGTAGPMPVDNLYFEVTATSTGKMAFRGQLELVTKTDAWSGNSVFRADFSRVRDEGEYILSVPGLGKSQVFNISKDVFKPVFRKTFRLFYHSRNSTAIIAPWADPGFERTGGVNPELSARIHRAVAASSFSNNEKPGSYKPVRRGWFDAGDYGQYVVNAAPVWYAFGLAMDLMPSVFKSDDLDLPESKNGTPDLIDELEWGMDWLLDMQNPGNGGVYSRLVPLRWDETSPQDVTRPRYLFEITSHATASFAAMTALHARLLSQSNPQRAARVLAASMSAWHFLENNRQWPAEGDLYKNPKNVHAGEYPDKSATDNRLWAAAELYRTTGDVNFKMAFMALLRGFKPDPTEGVTFRHQAMAGYWSMYLALQEHAATPGGVMTEPDILMQAQLAEVLIASANWYLRKADEHPFNAPMHQHKPFTGWGSFAHSSKVILPLLQAWIISGERQYCHRAAQMSNSQLGANPQSISYITGTGSRSPHHPLSSISRHDSQELPLNGIPVNGPHYHLPALWPSTIAVNETYIPEAVGNGEDTGQNLEYPPLRRYVDSYLLPPMSEPTIAEYAYTAVAYGLLSNETLLCPADG